MEVQKYTPTFLPLVDGCKSHGIGRTVAFELTKNGLLETFTIGTRRYVKLESLHTLPERLADVKAKAGVK